MFDNDRRLADHFIGKLHIGYREIRDHVAKLQAKRAKLSSSSERDRDRDRERDRERDRDRRR
jgi:hypothetical protein